VTEFSFAVGNEQEDGHFLVSGFSVPRRQGGTSFRACSKVFVLRVPAAREGTTRVTLRILSDLPSPGIEFTVSGETLGTFSATGGEWSDWSVELGGSLPRENGFIVLRAEAGIDPASPPRRTLALSRVTVSVDGEFQIGDPGELVRNTIMRPPTRIATMYRSHHEIRKIGPIYGPFSDRYPYSEERRIFFGDLHVHTEYSLCGKPNNRSISENVKIAKERGHDFVAVTDHAEHMDRDAWKRYFGEIRKASEEHGILTIPAIEWTSFEHGHRNVYFLSDEAPPYFSSHVFETDHPKKLADFFERHGIEAFAVSHHPAYMSHLADFRSVDPRSEPLVEIYSTWGNSERRGAPLQDTHNTMPGGYVRDALAQGYKLGFIGGGDVHNTVPGDGGLAAVIAPELTRESIYRALKDRFCYATSGDKICVDFHINGFPMGSILRVNQYSVNKLFPIHLAMSTVCPGPLARVELVANGETIYTSPHRECKTEADLYLCFEKSMTPDRIEEGRASHLVNVSRWYYVRVIQQDGAMAWSSPIWIDYEFQWE
jgi:hypothetical protein